VDLWVLSHSKLWIVKGRREEKEGENRIHQDLAIALRLKERKTLYDSTTVLFSWTLCYVIVIMLHWIVVLE